MLDEAFFIPEKLIRRPPGGQIKGVQALHTPWSLSATLPLNHLSKTPHHVLLSWYTSSEGTSPLCVPLPGKAIKLFFSTSPKTLSPRFNSALVHKGPVFVVTTRVCWLFDHLMNTSPSNKVTTDKTPVTAMLPEGLLGLLSRPYLWYRI